MTNAFTSALRNATYTENGHAAVSSTGSAVLDFYGQVGGLRDAELDRVFKLFEAAIADDKLLAARAMFYARDCRGGVGERELFRNLLHYAAVFHPEMVRPNLQYIKDFGRWDDYYALVTTGLEGEMFNLVKKQLLQDVRDCRDGKPISLAAKWLKSCNASSKATRALGKKTARALEMDEEIYRKILADLREYLKVVEHQMSKNQWSDINYETVPSRAGLQYREAFKRHDMERYVQFLEEVAEGKKTIHAAMNTPQDLVHIYAPSGWCPSSALEDSTVEAMWKNLPDFVNSDENVLCMVDVSGSMIGRPLEISAGLGMYFAQHNRGAFHNVFMTFESKPAFVILDDNGSFLRNLRRTLEAPWGGSTNLNRACQELLRFAREHRVPDADMPKRLIIISDMEIDQANSGQLHSNELREMYEAAGYTMPQLIYWNAESRHNHFQTKADTQGVMLASGSSPAVFQAVMEMKDYSVTPVEAMIEVLNKNYSMITVE